MIKNSRSIAIPPGATIKEMLQDRGMNQKEFAVRMDMSEKHISRLINGEVQLVPEMALKLEMVLGAPASFWNNLEGIYREKIAKINAENAIEEDLQLAKKFPYSEMAKLGWVPAAKNAKEKVFYLRKYFEVVELSLLERRQLLNVACRPVSISEKNDLAFMAWAQAAKLAARNLETAHINVKALLKALPALRKMTLLESEELTERLKEFLAKFGVALVFMPAFKTAFPRGACFEDGNKIILILTVTDVAVETMWFDLMQELAHIALGHLGCSEDDAEGRLAAESWSKDFLIQPLAFDKFKKAGDYSKERVILFAESQGIAPGIVVERMQMDRIIAYSMLNELKRNFPAKKC